MSKKKSKKSEINPMPAVYAITAASTVAFGAVVYGLVKIYRG